MSVDFTFTKENLDACLSRLAKEFRKLNGTKSPAEIVLIGGAAVLANYGFRDMTYDIDAVIRASSSMKDAINRVGDKLPQSSQEFITEIMKTGQLEKLYEQYRSTEKSTKESLIQFEQKYPGVTNTDNVNDIIRILKKRKEHEQG